MTRKGKRPTAKPRRAPAPRNPLARALADKRHGQRVVKTATAYKRRPKHRGKDEGDG